jgi:hypothetical protein
MANTLFIVEDIDFTNLPDSVRDNGLAETKKLFAFITNFNVVTRQPTQFPATLDFTDSIVKIVETDDVVSAVQNQSIRQQTSNILHSIRQNGMNATTDVPKRFPATPERGGVGFQRKEIITIGAAKLAMTVTGGVAALEAVKSDVVDAFSDGYSRAEILKHRDDQIKKKGPAGYFGKHEALIDERRLNAWDQLNRDLVDWTKDSQGAVGVGLGRLIAHEARHQYIEPHFNGGGLGASEAVLFGDKNFEQFDKADQKDISAKLQKFKTEQQKATIHLETLPKGQPFPF